MLGAGKILTVDISMLRNINDVHVSAQQARQDHKLSWSQFPGDSGEQAPSDVTARTEEKIVEIIEHLENGRLNPEAENGRLNPEAEMSQRNKGETVQVSLGCILNALAKCLLSCSISSFFDGLPYATFNFGVS
jgi:hypothetical protein